MSDLIKTIKDLSHSISEDYLILGKGMNGSLIILHNDGKIENDEILKRICEQANQNVYLALFNDADTDKSNIQFDLADFDTVKSQIKTSEQAMNDYKTPPKDFRSLLEISVAEPKKDEAAVKVAELKQAVEYRDAFRKFRSQMETVKVSEARNAEDAFNKMAHEAKILVSKGESIADIAKIASRCVDEMGFGMQKVARAYDMIYRTLVDDGFNVSTNFTKTSSLRVNHNAEVLNAPKEFAASVEKVAALDEMLSNIDNVLEAFDSAIKESN